MKRFLSVFFAIVLVTSVFSSCGKGNEEGEHTESVEHIESAEHTESIEQAEQIEQTESKAEIITDEDRPYVPSCLTCMDMKRSRCYGCLGSGHVSCTLCSGKGTRDCVICYGTGKKRCYSCSGLGGKYEYDLITKQYVYKRCYSCIGGYMSCIPNYLCSCTAGKNPCVMCGSMGYIDCPDC